MLAALVLGQWTWLIAILGLALLITVHEFGHFIAAKSFGMRVEKFYVGFPPAALRRTWGETEYGIGIIPLGGFCKISGMTPEEEVPEDTGDRVYYKKPVWKRNITIVAGPFMNFLAAAVILIAVRRHPGRAHGVAHAGRGRARDPAAEAGLVAGDTLVGADGATWTTWDQASAYFRASPDKTIDADLPAEGRRSGADRRRSRWCTNPEDAGERLPRRAGRVSRRASGPAEGGHARRRAASRTSSSARSPASGGCSAARSARPGPTERSARSASSTSAARPWSRTGTRSCSRSSASTSASSTCCRSCRSTAGTSP